MSALRPSLSVLIFALATGVSAFAQGVAVNIVKPVKSHHTGGDILTIWVGVNSTNQIQSVTAETEGRQAALAFSDGYWKGTLNLAGLSKGPHLLKATAQDVLGNTGSDQVTFYYDHKPTLEVSAPLAESVATPLIHLTASCEDDLPPCSIDIDVKTNVSQFELLDANGSIDQTVSLDAYEGQAITLVFTAVDSGGQMTDSVERRVYVDSSCGLASVDDVPGKIVDVDADRILYLDPVTGAPVIRDREDQTDTPIPMPAGYVVVVASLSPRGAIFTAGGPLSGDEAVIEWQDNAVLDHGPPNSRSSLVVSGQYAIWSDMFDLFLRDLQAGTTGEVIALANPNNTRNDVASDGTVAFGATDHNIYRYETGIATPLTAAAGTVTYRYPVTDGTITVYTKVNTVGDDSTFAIVMHEGATTTEIAPLRENFAADPRQNYEVENGWVAFTKPTTTDQVHVFTIPPGGSPQQVSFFNANSVLETLAPNGEVTLLHHATDGRYFGTTTPPARRINSRLGKAYVIDGEWYVAIGRSLFLVVPEGTATTTTLTSSKNPSVQGESVAFTATVSGAGVTGTVLFRDGAQALAEEPLSGGTATFVTSSLSAGAHAITAEYRGDGTFNCSVSATLTQVVKSPTTTAVTSSPNPSRLGTQITFTATVSRVAGGGAPTGYVTFRDGAVNLVNKTLVNGVATYVTNAPRVGTHAITAVYSGDDNNGPSTSPVHNHVVLPPFGAPENLTATATDPTHVLVTWNAVMDAQFYELERKDGAGAFAIIASPANPQFTDASVTPEHAYLYRARAVDADGMRSAYSIIDPATTFTFNRDPLVPIQHIVRAADILELRAAIDAYSHVAGQGGGVYSPGAVPGATILLAHLTELRNELNAIRAALQLPPMPYTPGNVIQAAQVQELRNACK